MKTLLAALICISLLGCDPPARSHKRPSKPTLMVFGAVWCSPCHSMEPILRSLEAEGIVVKRIDIDREPELAAKYGVFSVPTFIGKDGDRIIGVTSRAKLVELCRKA